MAREQAPFASEYDLRRRVPELCGFRLFWLREAFPLRLSESVTYDDLVHGWDLPGLQSTDRVMYPGSTTGNSFNNTVCSPYAVTWHVDRTCHAVSAASFDQMCCTMRDTYGMNADLQPHPSRLLLDPEWVATPEEVLPLA